MDGFNNRFTDLEKQIRNFYTDYLTLEKDLKKIKEKQLNSASNISKLNEDFNIVMSLYEQKNENKRANKENV